MSAQHRRNTASSGSLVSRRARRARGAAGAMSLSLIGVIAVILGLFAPLVTNTSSVLAATAGTNASRTIVSDELNPDASPPLNQVFGVAIGGDIANIYGSPQAMQQNQDAVWSLRLPLDPGSYEYTTIVSTAFGDIELGQDGRSINDTQPYDVDVPDGATEAYFAFDPNTGVAEAGGIVAELATDIGQFPMLPDGNDFEVFFSAPPGVYNVQAIIFGQPAGNPGQVDVGDSGRAHVVINQNGEIQEAESVDTARLFVSKTDEGGNPQPGACFAVYDGDDVLGQNCDANDGSEDGTAMLLFLNGVPGGSNDLEETFTPDGQAAAEGESINLDNGDNQINMVAAGGAVEEPPEEEAFTIELVSFDQDSGNLLPGACYALSNGGEQCDDDGDGRVTFENVPAGDTEVTQTQPPEGYEGAGSTTINVQGDGEFQIPLVASAPEEEALGTLVANVIDENGDQLPFACFDVTGLGEQCDGDDGDADMTQPDLPPGEYEVTLTVPDGYEATSDTSQVAQVNSDETTTVTFQVQSIAAVTEAETGSLVLIKTDEDGNQLPGSCFEVDPAGDTPGDSFTVCDEDDGSDDGNVNAGELPAGEYTLTETQTPDGFQAADPQNATVNAGEPAQVQIVNTTEEAEEEGVGTLVATVIDQDGNQVPFACFDVTDLGEQCDGDDDDAAMTQPDLPTGEYTVTLIVPDGYEGEGETSQTVEVVANETTGVEFNIAAVGAEVQEEDEAGTLTVLKSDDQGNALPGACFTLSATGDTQADDRTVCDNEDDSDDGVVSFGETAAGTYELDESTTPQGFQAGDATSVEVVAGEESQVQVENTPAEAEEGFGTLVATVVDQDGNQLPLACFDVSGLGEQCDGDDDDAAMTQPDLPTGEYTVSLIVPDGFEADGETTQTVTVNADETTNVEFNVTVEEGPAPIPPVDGGDEAGQLQITALDQGFPIPGFCVEVAGPVDGTFCDGDGNDQDPADGSILLDETPAGDYTVSMPNPPAGYEPAGETTVTVPGGGLGSVEINAGSAGQAVVGTGTLAIEKSDENGDPLGGACFQVGDLNVCDDQDGDAAPGEPGVIRVENIPAGTVSVSETQAPEGYEPSGESQDVEIQQGGEATIEVSNTPLPSATGAIRINKTDDAGERIGGACFELTGVGDPIAVCDDQEGDGSPTPGVVLIENLAPGEYTITETQAPAGFVPGDPQIVTVTAGEVTRPDFPNAVAQGSISVNKVDAADGAPLSGACFTATHTDSGEERSACDSDDGAENQLTIFEDVGTGVWTVVETTAPAGYDLATDPQDVEVTPGLDATISFNNTRSTGSIQVSKTDAATNELLGGACFTFGSDQQFCDNDASDQDSTDGVMLVGPVTTGSYTITEVTPPAGYTAGEPQQVEVISGEPVEVTFANTKATGSIAISKVDAADGATLLAGACFTVDDGEAVCDGAEGDADPTEGIVQIDEIEAGDHTVAETTAPEGFDLGAEPQNLTVVAGETAPLTFSNTATVTTGSISISKVDGADGTTLLAGACFTVDDGEAVCDGGEGDADPTEGIVLINDVPAGEHSVAETTAPEGFDLGAEPQNLTVVAGETEPLTFSNTATVTTGSISISKVDEVDGTTLLAGACFTVDDGEAICDGVEGDAEPTEGIVQIDGVEAGDHSVAESTAPEGFDLGTEPQNLTVIAGETAPLIFSNTAKVTTGSISISKVDEVDGTTLLPGACFTVDDGEAICDGVEGDADPTEGIVLINDVPAGEHSVTESTAPEGYELSGEPQVGIVAAGDTRAMLFSNTAFPGVLVINKTGEDGTTPLAGACLTISGAGTYQVCDNSAPDTDDADGVIRVEAVEAGLYTITEDQAPEGHVLPDDPVAENVEVQPGAETSVSVVNLTEPAPLPPVELEDGTLQVNKTDSDANALAGACFTLLGNSQVGPVCDNGEGDTDPSDGVIVIVDIPLGDYTLSESTAPEGFEPAADQGVSFTGSDAVVVDISNSAVAVDPGSLRINAEDGDGNLVGGGCYEVRGTEYCDNLADVDADPTPGTILIEGLSVGDVSVTESVTPPGFGPIEEAAETIVESAVEAIVTFSYEALEEEPGSVTFMLQAPDAEGEAGDESVEQACVTFTIDITDPAAEQTVCDGGEGDANDEPGQVTVEGLDPGVYKGWQSTEDAVDQAGFAAVAPASSDETKVPTTFEVKSGQSIVVIIIIIELPDEGILSIIKRAEDTNALQLGACFEVVGEGQDIAVCDNDGVDENSTDGVIRLSNLPSGDYTITETDAPPGYEIADPIDVEINKGLTTTTTIKDPPSTETTGDLEVTKVDGEDELLPGSCFRLKQNAVFVGAAVCDDDDGANDGVISFADVAPGEYDLVETQSPSNDYEPAIDQEIEIVAGELTEITIVNLPKPGSLEITKVNAADDTPLAGACFGLDPGSGIDYEVCDQDADDNDNGVGVIEFLGIPAGEYALIETQSPVGFDPAPDQDIEIEPNSQLELTIENEESPPPAATGTLEVEKVDQEGDPLPGACFSLKQNGVTKYAEVCDNDDGANDGTITFEEIGTGTYQLHETRKPSPSYQSVADRNVTVFEDQTTTVIVQNKLKLGRILVTKVNQQGQTLLNACFKVTPGTAPEVCTNGNGEALFQNLSPGVYKVTETKAPNGYEPSAPVTNVVVTPGLTTAIKIIDKKSPPPDDHGSIKIIKFFCPQIGNQSWAVYDSSDAGEKKLASTANCIKGNAQFTITAKSSEGDPIVVSTGADGETQVILPASIYTLTESKTGISVDVQVYVEQQTTVVFINYTPVKLEPPKIRVAKYACEPGYEGSYYIDFITNCGAYEDLTNGVTVRIEGPVVAKRVTGDSGSRGVSYFTQLKPGTYTMTEEGNADNVYIWCGLTPEGDEYGAYGSKITFPLAPGQTMWCAYFNVPDPVTDDTGTIVVTKFVCELPEVKRPANFDWEGECDIYSGGSKFGLSTVTGETVTPKSSGVTGADGKLRFADLEPGAYQLKELSGEWCHAESDSVDAKGNVLVKAGAVANVFIFNCVPIVEPPNTGSGATAGVGPQADIGAADAQASSSLVLMTPLAGVALLGLRRWTARQRAA